MLTRARMLTFAGCLGFASACATTERTDPDDDDAPPVDAAGFIDAVDVHLPDAAAAIDGPVWIDAAEIADAGPNGPFCTNNSQCTVPHECCWILLPPNGICTYGDILPILGCFPADPPADAGM